MSDLLTAAAAALDTPEALVERSAAARAAANGTTTEEVLSAWAGGAPVAASAPAPATEPVAETEEATTAEPEPVEAPAAAVEAPAPEPQPVTALAQEEPPENVDPVPLTVRIRTGTRIGAWAGAALGLLGFLVATTFWGNTSSVIGEGPYTPVIQTDSNGVVIGAALISIVFGGIVAGLSRASTAWVNPGMRLSNSAKSSAWLGAFLGLVLGVVAGALLTSAFGTPIEGSEGLVQMPVLPTMTVMIIGGAVLGAITAAVTQLVGVPVAVEEDDAVEIAKLRKRLSGAVGIPVAGLALLLILVLPFAYALIQSNHLTAGGAAIIATITAAGILTFASLAGSRPNMSISFGEAMVAVVGIATVVIVIFAVLLARSPAEDHSGEETGSAVVVSVL